ncbi:hypothetical protein [Terrisporobacter vanillatitrophus]|uniref:hypothetical protein n=1 Tax=Terrisporobacter vanillatitrophus TaxID=3058402 RepID=UPI00336611F9
MLTKKFYAWLNNHLEKMPLNVIALNFNLYEGEYKTYDIQLIGSDIFNEEDDDWACDEIFSTEESLFSIPIYDDISDWRESMTFIKEMIKEYMKVGEYSNKLIQLQAVGLGFVDGDIELIYLNNNK